MKHSVCCNAKIHKQNDVLFCTHCISIIDKSQVKKQNRLFICILAGFLATFLFVQANAPTTNLPTFKYVVNKAESIITFDVELNDSAITKELIKDGCILPNIAIAQAKIESSHYTSNKTFTNLNIFGIKFHKCKYVKGVNNYQAVYSSYKDCIADYCEIQRLYLKNIDGHYAMDKRYVELIKKVK